MTDTIRILPGMASDTMWLRADSALADCTDLDSDGAGLFIVKRYERLSSGEELLWSVLGYINGAPGHPTTDALAEGLDARNVKAATRALAAVGVVA